MRYIGGIIGVIIGLLIVVYRERIKQQVGSVSFAERWFGPGGTYTFLMLFGLLLSIGSILWMTGTVQSLLSSLLGPLFPTE